MAERKPLVVINGTTQEIPAGDTISGTIAPGSGGSLALDGLSDVYAPTPNDGDMIIYSGDNSRYELQPQPGPPNIVDLGGVDLTTIAPVTGDAIVYDGTNYVNGPPMIWPPVEVGQWQLAWGVSNLSATVTHTKDVLICCKVYLAPATYDAVGFNILSGAGSAGSEARMGLYKVAASGELGALVVDAGTQSITTTGQKTFTFGSPVILNGWYWIVMVHNSTTGIGVAAADSRSAGYYQGQSAISGSSVGYSEGAFTYAALPTSSLPAITPTLTGGQSMLRFAVKRSA